jgi:hypothetical protein
MTPEETLMIRYFKPKSGGLAGAHFVEASRGGAEEVRP